MRVLLTGAAGMVGRNLLCHPDRCRHEWLCPTRGEVDLTSAEAVGRFIRDQRPDFIVHAAGKVGGIQANVKEPIAFLLENLDIGRNVLMEAASAGVPRLLNLGSSCMYPRDRDGALVEEDVLSGALEPTNEGYALAKIAVARLAEYIGRERSGLSYKTMIPCNLYGPFDKFDPATSHMIPAVLRKLHLAKVSGGETVEIWGSGEARREFMYAGDLADAVLLCIDSFDSMPAVMNVGLGIDWTVNEYYEAAAEVVGYRGRFVHDLSKPVGMKRKLTSTAKATQWGWRPRTTLKAGLERTYAYFLETVDGARA